MENQIENQNQRIEVIEDSSTIDCTDIMPEFILDLTRIL